VLVSNYLGQDVIYLMCLGEMDCSNMIIAFRVDSSVCIGTGHIIRCLTLADELSQLGAKCHFFIRKQKGSIHNFILDKGYKVHLLPEIKTDLNPNISDENLSNTINLSQHSDWLAGGWENDAADCLKLVKVIKPDLLIVDHYGIDERWEVIFSNYTRLMVIDDLADRVHKCDILLDQTFGRSVGDYQLLVSADCQLLCGLKYALLRPEFAQLRRSSLRRRLIPAINHLLINMGGVDKDDATSEVLKALIGCDLPELTKITVVMGLTAPWVENVQNLAKDMPWETIVRVGISDMAEVMAASDLAIGAAGSTSWERCCLGLPSIMVVLAKNQRASCLNMSIAKLGRMIDSVEHIGSNLAYEIRYFSSNTMNMARSTDLMSNVIDGYGAKEVATIIIEKTK